MKTIQISLDEELLTKIDFLVKRGMYSNRKEAIQDLIKKGLENIELIEDDYQLDVQYRKLLTGLLSLKEPPNLLSTDKSITALVSEQRERDE